MESFRNSFQKFFKSFSSFWETQSTPKKIGIGGALVVAIIAGLSIAVFSGGKQYDYVFTNLDSEDMRSIKDYFDRNNIGEYIIDDKGVKVPIEKVLDIRLQLSQEGLPSNGHVGWEKFDDPDFTRTEFERKIHRIRAIQGELGRTITAMESVSSARVHIVMPENRLFEKDQQPATAAVYIKTDRGKMLSRRQIEGIVHLISKSVEGLHVDNISIIDFEGKLLTDEQGKNTSSREKKEMLEYKRTIEKNLEQKVRSIVGRVVGQDRVDAKVDVVIDFTKEEKTISDVDPDRTVVISQNTTAQSTQGSGLNPTGVPGAKSNVPGEEESLSLGTSSAENKRDTELVNYEVSKTVSRKVLPTGSLKRISAAVIVDGTQPMSADGREVPFEPRTPEEMAKIEELVKSAIGFVPDRDEIKVHNLRFQLDYTQVESLASEKQESRQYISTLVISATVALALVLFFGFVVRPYFRWLAYDPQRKEEQTLVEEFRPDLEMTSVQNVQVKEDIPFDKLTTEEKVMHLARHEPIRTTEAIRMLLNPHSSSSV